MYPVTVAKLESAGSRFGGADLFAAGGDIVGAADPPHTVPICRRHRRLGWTR